MRGSFFLAVFLLRSIYMAIAKELIEKNRQRLTDEKVRLGGLLGRIAKPKKAGGEEFEAKYPEFGNQEDENASEVAAYEANIAEERDLEKKLKKVEAALQRVAKGTYGICQVGGEPLPLARLEAIPEAENCVAHDRR